MRLLSVVGFLTFFNMGCIIFNKYDADEFQLQYPIIYGLLEDDPIALQNLVTYADILNNERRIRKFSQLETAYLYRDSVAIPVLSWKLENDNLFFEKNRELLKKETDQLGMHISSAEGIFGSVGPKIILEEKLTQLAPADYKLYQEFLHFQSFIRDGEYPYIDMKEEIQMISIGEKFFNDHPRSQYWQLIMDDFYKTLGNFLAVHKVIEEDTESFKIGGTNIAYWPFSTLIEDRKFFVDTYPDSRFNSIAKEIINDPSSINLNNKELFIVVTDWNISYDEAEEKRKKYFLNDKAIPHILEVRRINGDHKIVNGYRFHSDRSKAEKSLAHIKKGGLDAELVKVTEPGKVILKEVQ